MLPANRLPQAGRAEYTKSPKKSPRNLTQAVVSQLPTIRKTYHSQRNNGLFNCENSMENVAKPRFQTLARFALKLVWRANS
jgi:hypothetical protein